jgi:hypothetical protein
MSKKLLYQQTDRILRLLAISWLDMPHMTSGNRPALFTTRYFLFMASAISTQRFNSYLSLDLVQTIVISLSCFVDYVTNIEK